MATAQAQAKIAIPNDLEPYWMPFTANRAFKKRPKMIVWRQRHALHRQ